MDHSNYGNNAGQRRSVQTNPYASRQGGRGGTTGSGGRNSNNQNPYYRRTATAAAASSEPNTTATSSNANPYASSSLNASSLSETEAIAAAWNNAAYRAQNVNDFGETINNNVDAMDTSTARTSTNMTNATTGNDATSTMMMDTWQPPVPPIPSHQSRPHHHHQQQQQQPQSNQHAGNSNRNDFPPPQARKRNFNLAVDTTTPGTTQAAAASAAAAADASVLMNRSNTATSTTAKRPQTFEEAFGNIPLHPKALEDAPIQPQTLPLITPKNQPISNNANTNTNTNVTAGVHRHHPGAGSGVSGGVNVPTPSPANNNNNQSQQALENQIRLLKQQLEAKEEENFDLAATVSTLQTEQKIALDSLKEETKKKISTLENALRLEQGTTSRLNTNIRQKQHHIQSLEEETIQHKRNQHQYQQQQIQLEEETARLQQEATAASRALQQQQQQQQYHPKYQEQENSSSPSLFTIQRPPPVITIPSNNKKVASATTDVVRGQHLSQHQNGSHQQKQKEEEIRSLALFLLQICHNKIESKGIADDNASHEKHDQAREAMEERNLALSMQQVLTAIAYNTSDDSSAWTSIKLASYLLTMLPIPTISTVVTTKQRHHFLWHPMIQASQIIRNAITRAILSMDYNYNTNPSFMGIRGKKKKNSRLQRIHPDGSIRNDGFNNVFEEEDEKLDIPMVRNWIQYQLLGEIKIPRPFKLSSALLSSSVNPQQQSQLQQFRLKRRQQKQQKALSFQLLSTILQGNPIIPVHSTAIFWNMCLSKVQVAIHGIHRIRHIKNFGFCPPEEKQKDTSSTRTTAKKITGRRNSTRSTSTSSNSFVASTSGRKKKKIKLPKRRRLPLVELPSSVTAASSTGKKDDDDNGAFKTRGKRTDEDGDTVMDHVGNKDDGEQRGKEVSEHTSISGKGHDNDDMDDDDDGDDNDDYFYYDLISDSNDEVDNHVDDQLLAAAFSLLEQLIRVTQLPVLKKWYCESKNSDRALTIGSIRFDLTPTEADLLNCYSDGLATVCKILDLYEFAIDYHKHIQLDKLPPWYHNGISLLSTVGKTAMGMKVLRTRVLDLSVIAMKKKYDSVGSSWMPNALDLSIRQLFMFSLLEDHNDCTQEVIVAPILFKHQYQAAVEGWVRFLYQSLIWVYQRRKLQKQQQNGRSSNASIAIATSTSTAIQGNKTDQYYGEGFIDEIDYDEHIEVTFRSLVFDYQDYFCSAMTRLLTDPSIRDDIQTLIRVLMLRLEEDEYDHEDWLEEEKKKAAAARKKKKAAAKTKR